MELYLQFGHGMMEHTRRLIGEWGGGTAILSPRDLDDGQLVRLADDVHRIGGRIWIDPQVYLPRANHHRLIGHDYWPLDYQTAFLSGGPEMDSLFEQLRELNDRAGADALVVPGLYGEQIDNDWLTIHERLIAASVRICAGYTRFSTLSISGNSLRNEDEIEVLVNACENWDVDGFYVVPEHPGGDYLVDDPLWLTNLLLLVSGLRLLEREVVVGYCSHQMLSLAVTRVDAICSGTWLNVRSFPPSKFRNPDEDSQSRRALWYYCPQAFTEFKIPFLDLARTAGVLNELRPGPSLESDDSAILFSGAQPTSTAYNETASFRHYLRALCHQVAESQKATYQETLDHQFRMLEDARHLLEKLHKNGVLGQQRDFADIVDVNVGALRRFDSIRGFVTERVW